MKIDPRNLIWVQQPKLYIATEEKIILETEPFTDLHPSKPGAEAIQLSLEAKGSFCFSIRSDFEYQNPFDQCGIVIYKGKKKRVVFGTEYRDTERTSLQCTVYHDEMGDRSGRDIGSAINRMYYRIWYRGGELRIQYSFAGRRYGDMRKFWLAPDKDKLSIGIYACSPSNSTFDCTFREMILEEG